jgi:superoxide dismutase, Cu-Zn family
MKTLERFLIASIALALVACSSAQRARDAVAAAKVVMYNTAGAPIGTALLTQDASGTVTVDIASITLPAGQHGIHFHDVGKCDGSTTPAFSTAGGHYNPLAKEHGLQNPNGPHAGDNPNITVPASGIGAVSFSTNRVTLTQGPTSLLDANGSALVIHAGPDDQLTNPAGNSGARIACGVVTASP